MPEHSKEYLQKRIKQLEVLIMQEGLTKLPNYRYFKDSFKRELSRAKRFGYSLSLMVIDINKFKELNDTKGHLFGNQIIQQVAEMLAEKVRKYDVLCRYGGDEFVVIFPKVSKEEAIGLRGKLKRYIERTTFVTISVGISNYPEDGKSLKTLFNRADKDMYKDKDK